MTREGTSVAEISRRLSSRGIARFFALAIAAVSIIGLNACVKPNDNVYSMPVTAEVDRSNFDRNIFDQLDAALEESIKEQWVPGAVLVIRRNGSPVYERAVGTERMENGALRIRRNTIFDVASLTKPLAGVPAALLICPDKETLNAGSPSVAMILQHRAGYSSNIDIGELARDGLLATLNRQQPSAVPGKYDLYSNTGYMVLSSRVGKELGGEVILKLRERFWFSLGADGMTWQPRKAFARIAVSGRRADGGFLKGEAYDPVAAGWAQVPYFPPLHSGLFATAPEIANYFDRLLVLPSVATGDLRRLADLLYGEPTLAPALDRPGIEIWRTPGGLESAVREPLAPDNAVPGRYLSQTGHTGCIVWIDTQTRTTVVLLTNSTGGYKPENWLKLRNEVIKIVRSGIIEM